MWGASLALVDQLPDDQQQRRPVAEQLPGLGEQLVALVGADEAERAEDSLGLGQPEPAPGLGALGALEPAQGEQAEDLRAHPRGLLDPPGGVVAVGDDQVRRPVDRDQPPGPADPKSSSGRASWAVQNDRLAAREPLHQARVQVRVERRLEVDQRRSPGVDGEGGRGGGAGPLDQAARVATADRDPASCRGRAVGAPAGPVGDRKPAPDRVGLAGIGEQAACDQLGPYAGLRERPAV